MITLEKIALAINEKLIEVLPDIPIQTTDISEGFQRPSLFVDFEDATRSAYNSSSVERTIPVVIFYFPKDRHKYKLELLRVQQVLEDAFSGHFTIQDGFVVYPETTCDRVDGVLQCRFDVYYIQQIEDDTGEVMASLDFALHKEE
ncbi:hypothetical protein B2I21_07465 [Chryseobacterium mucoviscidosis]|nr:hypothetical protein B2I21_07465 [Chryseobacterium mucoviscidosis]